MKIALCQINPTVGDVSNNRDKMTEMVAAASSKGADLVLFGELSLSGAPLGDLVFHPDFCDKCFSALADIAEAGKECATLVGLPVMAQDEAFNAVAMLGGGEVKEVFMKAMPSSRQERMVFSGIDSPEFEGADDGEMPAYTISVDGVDILVVVGDDMRFTDTLECFGRNGEKPDLIVNLTAKRFAHQIIEEDAENYSSLAAALSTPIIVCGITGGCVDTVFHGGSMAFDAEGRMVFKGKNFEEDLVMLDFDAREGFGRVPRQSLPVSSKSSKARHAYKAMVMAVRDYFGKNGFKRATIGLSGGIDSAVVAAIAVDALGAQCVRGVMMPSRFSSEGSITDSIKLAANLGIECVELSIEKMFSASLETLAPLFGESPFTVAEENIQSRLRGVLLMAVANKFDTLVLNTTNKSESAMGYGTLYGDTNGALSVLGDLYKTEVYEVAEYINRNGEVIPETIINKAPSAELREGQRDSDSLPPYDKLDAVLYALIEENMSVMDCAAECGVAIDTVMWVDRMLKINEYKRHQLPPVVSLSRMTLTKDRTMPVIVKY